MAKLFFRYGAMSCGKSTSLLQVAYNYKEKDKKVVLIKPKCDTKGNKNIVSRIGLSQEVDYLIDSEDSIINVLQNSLSTIDCILVDEAQFFKKEHIDELFIITKMYDVPIICYGLKSDFKTNSFSGSMRLFELADELQELETICRCGKKARFNARVIDGKFVVDGDQIAIDGEKAISYESLCGKCYIEEVMQKQNDALINNIKILNK